MIPVLYTLSALTTSAMAATEFSPWKVAEDFSDQTRESGLQTKAHNIYLPRVICEENRGILSLSNHLAGLPLQSLEPLANDAPDYPL